MENGTKVIRFHKQTKKYNTEKYDDFIGLIFIYFKNNKK